MRRCFLVCAAILLTCSCVPDYGYVSVAYVPDNYAIYPHTYYDGYPAYYIDGRWYVRRHDHWGYYREEPPDLYRYRYRTHVQRAPRAYPSEQERREQERREHEHHEHEHQHPNEHERGRRQSAPPARQSAPPARQSAPPAQRVR